jgi:hypothetical protein
MVEARLAMPSPTTRENRKARDRGAKFAKDAAINKIHSSQREKKQSEAMKTKREERLTQLPADLTMPPAKRPGKSPE